jgi:hypothetical protein
MRCTGDWRKAMRLTVGPHVAVSESECEKRVADTWDREGIGVHLAVAHREREREPVEWAHDAGRVQVNCSGPTEIRKGFLNLDKGFPI